MFLFLPGIRQNMYMGVHCACSSMTNSNRLRGAFLCLSALSASPLLFSRLALFIKYTMSGQQLPPSVSGFPSFPGPRPGMLPVGANGMLGMNMPMPPFLPPGMGVGIGGQPGMNMAMGGERSSINHPLVSHPHPRHDCAKLNAVICVESGAS